ncbi:MAG: hypothetical protein Q4G16_06345 [Cruoricaptor ignavus]|nr:hypothetical protein [Cruoricaptor ignavus]
MELILSTFHSDSFCVATTDVLASEFILMELMLSIFHSDSFCVATTDILDGLKFK